MVEIRLAPGAEVVQDLPADYNGFFFVLSGQAIVAGPAVTAGQLAWLTRPGADAIGSTVRIAAGAEGTRLLLFAGRPLGEPVVARGPFVMNTEAQIEEAYRDYRTGRFSPCRGAVHPSMTKGGSCDVVQSERTPL